MLRVPVSGNVTDITRLARLLTNWGPIRPKLFKTVKEIVLIFQVLVKRAFKCSFITDIDVSQVGRHDKMF